MSRIRISIALEFFLPSEKIEKKEKEKRKKEHTQKEINLKTNPKGLIFIKYKLYYEFRIISIIFLSDGSESKTGLRKIKISFYEKCVKTNVCTNTQIYL